MTGITASCPDANGGATELPRSNIKIVGFSADKGSFSFALQLNQLYRS
jgi:hypothetical protein